MTAIPFPTSSSPGERPQLGAGRLINCCYEPRGNNAGPIWRRVPGLDAWGTTDYDTPRGFLLDGSALFAAVNGKLVRWSDSGGAATVVDDLEGTAKVYFARNNKSPTPDLVVVTENGAFSFTTSAVVDFVDTDLPFPVDVCFVGGYLFFAIGDGRVYASGLNAVTVNPLDYATAESKPDGLYRCIPGGKNLLLLGPNSIELWGEPINATGFPLSYIATIARGLIAPNAIAGYEDGFGRGILLVTSDNAVNRLDGYELSKVSTFDIDRLIEAVADKTELEACVYISGGHACWQLSSATWTYVYDYETGQWHERQSHLLTRARISTTVNAFGKWICGDTESGDFLHITSTKKSEVGNPFRVRIESGPVDKFPQRTRIGRADFKIATGVGVALGEDPLETEPDVAISWSDDGGVSWSNPVLRPLGAQAHAETRISIFNTGMSGPLGRRWRLDMSAPVDFGLLGGDQSDEARYF